MKVFCFVLIIFALLVILTVGTLSDLPEKIACLWTSRGFGLVNPL
jgi:hypothetical protein